MQKINFKKLQAYYLIFVPIKIMTNQIHIIPKDGKWAIKKSGSNKIIRTIETKDEAVAAARRIAIDEKLELVIHNKDGKISDSDSYGNDPSSRKDNIH